MVTTVREAWGRLSTYFRKRDLDQDLEEELSSHIDLATQEHVRQGMSLPEARRLALLKLGGIEQSKELYRESRGFRWLEDFFQDLRRVLRGLRRSPGFTVTAIATLAIGIGVNTAVFTVSKAALFSGFPLVKQNDRLVYIAMGRGCCVSYPDFIDWREAAKSFDRMAIIHGALRTLSDQNGFPEMYDVAEVSADTFKVVGQSPLLGRDFEPADEIPGASPVATLSYTFWERRFGANPAIVGQSVRINGASTTIIGVMPRGFSFPQKLDLWVPMVQTGEVMNRENRGEWCVVARLADGVTIQSAQAEMEAIGRRLSLTYPRTNRGPNLIPVVQTFRDFFIFQNETPVYWTMWGAVGFVLLIACANLANLMLARGVGQAHEVLVRSALGATRWRIMRERLMESVVLAIFGGVLGWWIAEQGVALYALADRGPGRSSWRILDYSMDYHVLGYVVAISVGAALLFGVIPAVRFARIDLSSALKDAGRSATAGGHRRRLSTLLVTGEMALAVLLLSGAGLMTRSFLNLYTANLGIKTADVLTIAINLPEARYGNGPAFVAFYDRVKSALESLPGVESVAIASALPGGGAAARLPYQLGGFEGDFRGDGTRPTLWAWRIGSDYFRTLGTAVLTGRDFSDLDSTSSTPVVIVNRRFAAKFWPGEDPLGKRMRLFAGRAPEPWLTIVGVAPDIAARNTGADDADPLVYLPYQQGPVKGMEVMVRTRLPASLTLPIRREIQKIDSALPIFGPLTLDERLKSTYYSNGLYGVLFLIFAAIALLLASMGLYAVVSYSVRQRTQEIGVRMAVGARASDILSLVLRQGLGPLGIGLGIGLAGSFALNQVVKAELVHVSPSDPITLVTASIVLICAALLGCWIPARRGTRVDPVVALRHE